jgi:transcriptional regulator with XRE-family HTH domain
MRRQQLLEARKEKGLSIAQVAKKAEITPRHYCYIESGERVGSFPVIKRIAKALDLTDINLF